MTVRNLRHSAASLMLTSGLRDLEVAHRLGHSKPSTTKDIYARFIPADENTIDPYEAMLADQDHGNTTGTAVTEKRRVARGHAG